MNLQHTLVAAAPEFQFEIVTLLVKFPIHQDIDACKKFWRHLAVRPSLRRQQIRLIRITGVAPDRLLRILLLKPEDQRQKRPLVLRLHRLSAQQRQAGYIAFSTGIEDLLYCLVREFLSIIKIPCDLIKTAPAPVSAAGHKKARPHSGAVGNVAMFDIGVFHDIIAPQTTDEALSP